MDVNEEKAAIRKEIQRLRAAIPAGILSEIDKLLPDYIAGLDDRELQSRIRKAGRIALSKVKSRLNVWQSILWDSASHAVSRG